MGKPSFKRRVKLERARQNRNGRFMVIAMLPAGLILIVGSIFQLRSGNYTVEQNFYGGLTGPSIQIIAGAILFCVGAIALWVQIQIRRKLPKPSHND